MEGGAFLAWGHLTYTKPLTDKQVSDYELRPAFNVHELRRKRGERPLTIAEQMKAARQQAQEQRGLEAPKKDKRGRIINEEDAEDILGFLDSVIDYVYQQPMAIEKRKRLREARKQRSKS